MRIEIIVRLVGLGGAEPLEKRDIFDSQLGADLGRNGVRSIPAICTAKGILGKLTRPRFVCKARNFLEAAKDLRFGGYAKYNEASAALGDNRLETRKHNPGLADRNFRALVGGAQHRHFTERI